jgi:hypothetical protein
MTRQTKKARCDFAEFLRGNHGADRKYALTGVLLARWLHKRVRKFGLDDVKIRRVPGTPYSTTRFWMNDFLSAWEVPSNSQSNLANRMLAKCPALHAKTLKFWDGV